MAPNFTCRNIIIIIIGVEDMEMKIHSTLHDEIKSNQIKSNQIKSNQIKANANSEAAK